MNKYLDKYIGFCFLFLSIIFSLIVFKDKHYKYITKYYENQNLLNKIKLCEQNIIDLNNNKKELEKKVLVNNEKIEHLKNELDVYSITENEFKKIMYNLSNKAGLNLIDITLKNKIDTTYNYNLNYSNVCLKGDLISLGKFLYYLNKIPFYIDTKYFSLSIKADKQILNLGYVEKGDLNE